MSLHATGRIGHLNAVYGGVPAASNPDDWVRKLTPFHNTVAGPGIRASMELICQSEPAFMMSSVPSGTSVGDWTVPNEWWVEDLRIECLCGRHRSFGLDSPLRVVQHSASFHGQIATEELLDHVHVSDRLPEALPYVTSYYSPSWGICMTWSERESLRCHEYRIDLSCVSEPGYLNYIEATAPGKTDREVLWSSYLCHPLMVNNELSGPAVLVELARFVLGLGQREFTHRFLLAPETIGTIAYAAENAALSSRTVGAFVLHSLGGDGPFAVVRSAQHVAMTDLAAEIGLRTSPDEPRLYEFRHRDSNARHLNAGHLDIPTTEISQTKPGSYDEYHTSSDDARFLRGDALGRALDQLKCVFRLINSEGGSEIYRAMQPGEPFMTRHGLLAGPATTPEFPANVNSLLQVASLSNGSRPVAEISLRLGMDVAEVLRASEWLVGIGYAERTK